MAMSTEAPPIAATVPAATVAPADETVWQWVATFARYTPPVRPLAVLDLGSGTGRFTPALASAFGGPVYGVEPSSRLRAIAERDAAYPNVTYLDGRAEAIPLPDDRCDVALLFMSLHHITRHDVAFAEVARVVKPLATVLIRCTFADRMPEAYWYRYFPAVRTAVGPSHRPVRDVIDTASAAGLDLVTLDTVATEPARSLREEYTRVRAMMTADPGPILVAEVAEGLAAMARDADRHGDRLIRPAAADLLVLRRSDRR